MVTPHVTSLKDERFCDLITTGNDIVMVKLMDDCHHGMMDVAVIKTAAVRLLG